MKKTIVLLLLPVFLYSIIGWQWIFVLRLNTHQSEEWSAFYDDEDLEIITVKTDEGKHHDTFIVNDHELYHHGKFFDIKYKKRRGDEIVFYCHPDHEEEGIFNSFNEQIKDNSGMKSDSQKSLKMFKLSVFEKDNGVALFDQSPICEIHFVFQETLKPFFRGNSFFVPPDTAFMIS